MRRPIPRAERRSVMTCAKLQAVRLCWIRVANPVTHTQRELTLGEAGGETVRARLAFTYLHIRATY